MTGQMADLDRRGRSGWPTGTARSLASMLAVGGQREQARGGRRLQARPRAASGVELLTWSEIAARVGSPTPTGYRRHGSASGRPHGDDVEVVQVSRFRDEALLCTCPPDRRQREVLDAVPRPLVASPGGCGPRRRRETLPASDQERGARAPSRPRIGTSIQRGWCRKTNTCRALRRGLFESLASSQANCSGAHHAGTRGLLKLPLAGGRVGLVRIQHDEPAASCARRRTTAGRSASRSWPRAPPAASGLAAPVDVVVAGDRVPGHEQLAHDVLELAHLHHPLRLLVVALDEVADGHHEVGAEQVHVVDRVLEDRDALVGAAGAVAEHHEAEGLLARRERQLDRALARSSGNARRPPPRPGARARGWRRARRGGADTDGQERAAHGRTGLGSGGARSAPASIHDPRGAARPAARSGASAPSAPQVRAVASTSSAAARSASSPPRCGRPCGRCGRSRPSGGRSRWRSRRSRSFKPRGEVRRRPCRRRCACTTRWGRQSSRRAGNVARGRASAAHASVRACIRSCFT